MCVCLSVCLSVQPFEKINDVASVIIRQSQVMNWRGQSMPNEVLSNEVSPNEVRQMKFRQIKFAKLKRGLPNNFFLSKT